MCRAPSQLLLFNSRDRIAGSISNATYRMVTPLVKIGRVRLENFVILNSFYAVTAANGNFTVTESLGPLATITIPPGTYDTVQFAAAVQAALNAAGLGNTYTVSVSLTTLRLTLTASGGALDPFSLSWPANSAQYPMGWGAGTAAPTAFLLSHVSPFAVGLANLNKLLIRLNTQSGGGALWASSSVNANFAVDVDVDFGSVFSYRPPVETFNSQRFLPPIDSTSLSIELIDPVTGGRVDTNGQEYQLELALWAACDCE